MEQLHHTLPTVFTTQPYLPFDIYTIHQKEGVGSALRKANKHENNFMVIWITNGAGHYCLAGKTEAIAHNRLLFIKPGECVSFKLTQGLEGYVVSFTPSFLDLVDKDTKFIFNSFFRLFTYTSGVWLTDDTTADLHYIMALMLKEFQRHNLYRSEILRRYFKIFVIYLTRQDKLPAENHKPSRNEELLNSFMTLLENNFRNMKMVADYAGQLSVTPNYLNEVIKKTSGQSAGHLIRQRIVLEAKRQAVYSKGCMKSIAYGLGFFDMAHFSKFFKNATGMNFTDFKKKDHLLTVA